MIVFVDGRNEIFESADDLMIAGFVVGTAHAPLSARHRVLRRAPRSIARDALGARRGPIADTRRGTTHTCRSADARRATRHTYGRRSSRNVTRGPRVHPLAVQEQLAPDVVRRVEDPARFEFESGERRQETC